MKGNSSLNEIELKLLGDVKGKSILHLQCHFGQDSISLSSMGEVVNSLIKNGLEILSLNEFDYSPFNCFNKAEDIAPKKFRLPQFNNALPMVYTINAKSQGSE